MCSPSHYLPILTIKKIGFIQGDRASHKHDCSPQNLLDFDESMSAIIVILMFHSNQSFCSYPVGQNLAHPTKPIHSFPISKDGFLLGWGRGVPCYCHDSDTSSPRTEHCGYAVTYKHPRDTSVVEYLFRLCEDVSP